MCQMGFPEFKNIILRTLECLKVTLRNVFDGISHKDWFTMSTAYKSGLRLPILAEKLHVYVYINSFCFDKSYSGEGLFCSLCFS